MKKVYLFLVMIMVCSITLSAQTEIPIAVGDDLIQAIVDAADGDILVLAQGTHVATYTTMNIEKSLTIKGAAGAEMPELYIQQFDVYANGVSFTLEDLHILGARVDSASGTPLHLDTLEADYVMNLVSSSLEPTDGAYNTFGDLTFQGCMVSHIEKAAIRGDRDSYALNSILVDDCIMHDFRGGSSYGPFRLKSKLTFNSFTATNSTFYDFPLVFLDCQDMASNPTTYMVANCTFYKWGGRVDGGKYLFDINSNDQASLIIKSCILGKSPQDETFLAEGFRFMEEATAEISFSAMTPDFVTNSMGYADVLWDKDEYNTVDIDPEWADPENGDFTLPEGSDFLQMSPEGTIIGDPRWDPNYGVGVPASEAVSLMEVYPNPASHTIRINLKEATGISVYSITGQQMLHEYLEAGENQMSLSELSPGIYFITAELKAEVIKLIVE